MDISKSSKIEDLLLIKPSIFYDFRGEYFETFSKEKYNFTDHTGNKINFVEDDISQSRKGVLRGLHGDEKTYKLIQCIYGEIFVSVIDMRKDSATYLNYESFSINDKNRWQILVPSGCANGHLCLSNKCIFSYKQSEYYSGMENQFTIRWDDPYFDIFWPIKSPILSKRDSNVEFLKFDK